jgi:septum formation protein
MSDSQALVLASSSPRRRQLLEQLGLRLLVAPSQVDEAELPGEPMRAYVARVARAKGIAVAAARPGEVVLAADTSVGLDGRLFGKPRDAEDAVRMLRELGGRTHEVVTGVFAAGPGGVYETVVVTRVRFRPVGEAEAAWYVATGEPMDKAGGYGIQDRGGMFVEAIEGSYSNVVGLPLAETLPLLARAGLRLPWEEGK